MQGSGCADIPPVLTVVTLSLCVTVQVAMLTWSYFAALITDPGEVPIGWHPFPDDAVRLQQLTALVAAGLPAGSVTSCQHDSSQSNTVERRGTCSVSDGARLRQSTSHIQQNLHYWRSSPSLILYVCRQQRGSWSCCSLLITT